MRSITTKIQTNLLLLTIIALMSISCSADKKHDDTSGKVTTETKTEAVAEQVGPVESVNLSAEIDQALTEKGKAYKTLS